MNETDVDTLEKNTLRPGPHHKRWFQALHPFSWIWTGITLTVLLCMLCIYLPIELTKSSPSIYSTAYHDPSILGTAKRVAPGYAARSQITIAEDKLANSPTPTLIETYSSIFADIMWTHPSGYVVGGSRSSLTVTIYQQDPATLKLFGLQTILLNNVTGGSVRVISGASAPLTFRYQETLYMFVTVGTAAGYGREIVVLQKLHDNTLWTQNSVVIRHPDQSYIISSNIRQTIPDAGTLGHRIVCSIDRSLFSPRLLIYTNGTQYKPDEPGGMVFVFSWSQGVARYLYKIQDLKLLMLNEQKRFVPSGNRLLSFGHHFTVEPNILGRPMLWISNPSSEDGNEVSDPTSVIPRRNFKGYIQGYIFDPLAGWVIDRTPQYWGFRYPNVSVTSALQDIPDGFGYTFQLVQRELRVLCGSPISANESTAVTITYPLNRLTLNVRYTKTPIPGLPIRPLMSSSTLAYRPHLAIIGRMFMIVSAAPSREPAIVWSVPDSVTAPITGMTFRDLGIDQPVDVISALPSYVGIGQSLSTWTSATQRTTFFIVNRPAEQSFNLYYVKYAF